MRSIEIIIDFICNYWAVIVIAGCIGYKIYSKIRKSDEAALDIQIDLAKIQVREIMLKLVTDAEREYDGWVKAGAIKRSEVIERVFEMYPVLRKVIDQGMLFNWMDAVIDDALLTMRQVLSANNKVEE